VQSTGGVMYCSGQWLGAERTLAVWTGEEWKGGLVWTGVDWWPDGTAR
jgi:hypothetical protein